MADRRRSRKFTAALLAGVALLWTAAPAAWAGGGHRDRHHRHSVHRHSGHDGPHGWHCDRHATRAHSRHRSDRDGRHARHARETRRAREGAYYCRPCKHRFHARSRFYGHLRHHHHLPLWAIPFVLVHWAATWTYHG